MGDHRSILADYACASASELGKEILENFDREILCFKKVIARDYQKMIRMIGKYEEQGISRENSELEAFRELTGTSV